MRVPLTPSESDEGLSLIDLEQSSLDSSTDSYYTMDFDSIATPERCIADFCLIPIGTPTASVSKEVAAVQELMKSSGLEYSMHSAGTTVEGSWDQVMEVIGKAHSLVHKNGVARVQTDIRAGTRTDKIQHFHEKVSKVEAILAHESPAKKNFFSSFIPVSATTSQIASYSSRVPWASASMHLRQSFGPGNDGNETTGQENSTRTSVGGRCKTSGLVWELQFNVNTVLTCLVAAYLLKNIFSSSVASTQDLDSKNCRALPSLKRAGNSWWGS